jgi:hypothetical protein
MSEEELADEEADTGGESAESEDVVSELEPTPQSDALRRQQLWVGSGVAVLGGVAVIVATAQRFPDYPFFVYALAGTAATAVLFTLVLRGQFSDGSADGE